MKLGKIGGLQQTKITPVPGVISPTNSNNASPTQVGSQATVKTPKSKSLPGALDKPSVFYKSEQNQVFKKPSIKALHEFLTKVKSKKKLY